MLRALVKPLLQPRIFSRASWFGVKCSLNREITSLVLVELKDEQTDMQGATASTLAAARSLGDSIVLLVAGHGVAAAAASAARLEGVEKVLLADHPRLEHQLAEPYSQVLKALQKRHSFSHILAPGSTFGKNILPRAAALLDVQPVSDVIKIIDADTFVRPVYAGNAFATVQYAQPGLRMLTVRPSAFPAEAAVAGTPATATSAPVEAVSLEELAACSEQDWGVQWVGQDVTKSERPELASAKAVICGGRALKSAENFQMLERIADLLGGAVGASRAAVDAGYVPNDLQVGQTGKLVAPQLYIGVGISGAIQHLAGMKDSKTIVAINTDGDAPIFQVADYGLVQDLFTALPELEAELAKVKAQGA